MLFALVERVASLFVVLRRAAVVRHCLQCRREVVCNDLQQFSTLRKTASEPGVATAWRGWSLGEKQCDSDRQ